MFKDDPLARRAMEGVAQFQVVLVLLIFLPALSLTYWQGWLLWSVVGLSILAIALRLIRHDRALLEARMQSGPAAEERPLQRRVQALTAMGLVLELVLSAVCHAIDVGQVGDFWVLAGNAAVAVAMAGIAWVMEANGTAHAAVHVSAGQRLVSTGPYALVRHPMYAASLLLFLALPLALGAWPPMVIAPVLGGLMGLRALDEEAMLRTGLPGYADYAARLRWRMVPGLW